MLEKKITYPQMGNYSVPIYYLLRHILHIKVIKPNKITAKTIEDQTEQAISNIKAVLSAAGSDISNVVKTTCFLASMNDFAKFNEIYGKYFTSKPARSCVEVSALPKGALVEIEVIAVK